MQPNIPSSEGSEEVSAAALERCGAGSYHAEAIAMAYAARYEGIETWRGSFKRACNFEGTVKARAGGSLKKEYV